MESIGNSRRQHQAILDGALNAVRPLLPSALIEQWCREAGHRWRNRMLGPVLTLLACVRKEWQPGTSARGVEDWLASLGAFAMSSARDGHDFCDARARLPLVVFERALSYVATQAIDRAGLVMFGLRVCNVDGSTTRAPRTKANCAAFKHSKNSSRKSVLPMVRMLWLICANCGAVLHVQLGTWRDGEMRLFLNMIPAIMSGTLVVGDTIFGSYLALWLLQQQDSHALCRNHPTRKSRHLKKLGRHDHLVEWKRPDSSDSAFPEQLRKAPRTMQIRIITRQIRRPGYRTWKLIVCTTLLDPKKFPADDLIALYVERWEIEVDTRSIKHLFDVNNLAGKSPDIVRKEIYSGLLAYNLTRAVMSCASKAVRTLSVKGARDLILLYCERMKEAPTVRLPGIYLEMLTLIQTAQIDAQERPGQPRCVIQNKRNYPLLKTSRANWRKTHNAA